MSRRCGAGTPNAALALACACVLLCACKEDAAPGGRAGTTGSAGASETRPSAGSVRPEHAFFQGWRPPEPAWLAPLRARIDAREAGWPTEHAALAVERELGPALAASLAGAASLEAFIDAEFEGATRLVPDGLATLYDAGGVRALGPVPEGPDGAAPAPLHDAEALAAELARWGAAFGGARPSAECRVVAVERRADGAFAMEVIVRVASRGRAPIRQDLARWRAVFAVSPDGRRVRAKRIELAAFARTEATAALFADATRAAFGRLPRFEDELLRGNEARLGYVDQLAGGDLVGSHGVAVGDVDGDGLEDVYVAQPGGLPNLLLLRNADGTVRAAEPAAGVGFLDSTFGVLIVDLDGDGARDLVAAAANGVVVAWNDGDLRFSLQQLPSTLAHSFYSLTAADPDGDGDLDLYGCRYMTGAYVDEGTADQVPTPYHDAENGAPNVYWRNAGARELVDATQAVGLDVNNTRFSLSSIWEDFDLDGDLDLYVTNDFGRNNLYRNDGERFTDVAGESDAVDMAASMGATLADVDRDGVLDLVVSNMFAPAGLRVSAQDEFLPEHPELRPLYRHHARGNSLLLGVGDGRFRDATETAGIAPGGWSWGTKFVDFDNDGQDDLYVPNGFVSGRSEEDLESYFWRTVVGSTPATPPATEHYDQAWKSLRELMVVDGYSFNGHERNYAYLNLGGGRFADVSAVSGADFEDDGRCATTLDWDGDGRTDLLVRNRTGPGLRLLLNAFPKAGAFVELELRGSGPNTDAVGAHLELVAGGAVYRRTVYAGDGYLGSSSKRLHVGLGGAQRIEALRVTWPDGSTQAFADLAASRRYALEQGGELATVAPRAFAGLRAETLLDDARPPTRIVLADRLPMADIDFPAGAGRRLSIAELAGGPTLIVLGAFATDPARAALEALVLRSPRLREAEARVVAVTLGEAGDAAAASAALEPSGLSFHVVPGEQGVLKTLQLMLLETLGPFDGLALPIVFVLDRTGNLAAIHQGPLGIDGAIADAAAVDRVPPSAPDGGRIDPLSGGRWLRPPRRNLSTVAEVFRILGRADLARRYAELERERQGR